MKPVYNPIEIFGGTGGVGKTSLSASRAISLASRGVKVLILTIDPSLRLKETLNLQTKTPGEVVSVPAPEFVEGDFTLDAMLMNSQKTILKIAERGNKELAENFIVKILSQPYAGLNEILALIELQLHYESQEYDCLILDTPPGDHFLDFLEGVEKVNAFFDQRFVDIFNSLYQPTDDKRGFLKKAFQKALSQTMKKLLSFLNQVTGEGFVTEFVQAINIIYQSKDAFLKALSFEKNLMDTDLTRWFIVTSVAQGKAQEAIELRKALNKKLKANPTILINKSYQYILENWEPPKEDENARDLKSALQQKEDFLVSEIQKQFTNVHLFKESLELESHLQVKDLVQTWESVD